MEDNSKLRFFNFCILLVYYC